ncbi:AaceriAER418Cp [[Ashbya] aceris (nom. inval.)]|nr:AaceriAER418Cp [[Ashbya] aceris (nom. inval.)]
MLSVLRNAGRPARAGRVFGSRSLFAGMVSRKNGAVDERAQRAASQPDGQATAMNDEFEFSKLLWAGRPVQGEGFRATWVNALAERQKQLAEGKVIDSYMYNSVKSTEVGEKTRAESFSYLVLPFKDDPVTADFYVNAAGRIRMGQIFQDLDALAGRIAYRHTAPAEPVLVTASVDRIYLLKRLGQITSYNVVLYGSVAWTGRSSMEISIKAAALDGAVPATVSEATMDERDVFLTASFTFVARNPETHRSLAINKLLPQNQQEWVEFRRAESHNSAKKLQAQSESLETNPPTAEESRMIHALWRASRGTPREARPSGVVSMRDTNLKSTMFMQPQYRNRHSYMIFGGYLMRQTFELAYCAASSISHSLPRFVSLDSTTFRAPVPVGSILHMDATVVYTEHIRGGPDALAAVSDALADFQPPAVNKLCDNKDDFLSCPGTLVQVKVDTVVQELASENKTKSGSFIFSFFAPAQQEGSDSDPRFVSVVPETYSEMINYVDGRRRAVNTAMYASRVKRQSKL